MLKKAECERVKWLTMADIFVYFLGVGALYVRRRPRVRLEPIQSGGGQERGLRSGTVPTPLVVGMGSAAHLAQYEMDVRCNYFIRKLISFFWYMFRYNLQNDAQVYQLMMLPRSRALKGLCWGGRLHFHNRPKTWRCFNRRNNILYVEFMCKIEVFLPNIVMEFTFTKSQPLQEQIVSNTIAKMNSWVSTIRNLNVKLHTIRSEFVRVNCRWSVGKSVGKSCRRKLKFC